MLHIILLILKIIGIILAAVFGVVLLALFCALFVPLRYRIEVSREEGEGSPPVTVRVKVTWLLHLVNVLIRYPADVYVRVRVFLFTLFRMPEAEKKQARKTGKAKKEHRKEKKEDPEAVPAGEQEEDGRTEPGAPVPDAAGGPEEAEEPEAEENPKGSEENAEADRGSAEASGGILRRIADRIRALIDKGKRILEKIKATLQKILYTIRHMCDKIETASDTVRYYHEVLQSDAFRHSWELCRGQAVVLLKELKPDRFETDLVVGTGDPASTGEILAVCGMLYPLLGPQVRIVGDFERARLEGFVFIRGKIRAFTFLRVAWKVYRNKEIRTLIKLFKKEAV